MGTRTTWTLRGKDGTAYAELGQMVQRGSSWFAALQPHAEFARIKPFFDAMAEYLESHGTPPGDAALASISSLGLCLEDPQGVLRAVKDLQIIDELVSFTLA